MNPIRLGSIALGFLLIPFFLSHGLAQNPSPTPTPTPTLGLEQGFQEFDTPDFKLKLVKASQTIGALQPNNSNGFDFTPNDRLGRRAANGYYHLGDLTFRLRTNSSDSWREFSTAAARKPVLRWKPKQAATAV